MTEELEVIREKLVSLPRNWKKSILIAMDVLLLTFAVWASFGLRLDRWAVPSNFSEIVIIVSAPLAAIPVFVRMGLYRAVVRYLPERALWTTVQSVALATLLWVFFAFLSQLMGQIVVPRSVPVIYWALASILITGSRFAAKRLFWPPSRGKGRNKPAVLIYGAGVTGAHLAASLRSSYFVVGFLDDDPALARREVAGLRVYAPSQLEALIRTYGIKQVILSMPSISASRRKEIVTTLSGKGVTVQSLPSLSDLATGKYLLSQVRDIEIGELLGRSSVPPDLELIEKMVTGRAIMVTGAGGSIGSELCRKISRWHPQRLVLFEANEFALYQIDRELASGNEAIVVPILGSVTDQRRVAQAIVSHNVEVVFHAAAHKHVPLVEANALEGISNNVFGTKVVVDTAYDLGVEDLVLISSDKAVRPTNVMGATKRWAELIVQDASHRAVSGNTGQRFSSVRFGNVLGSNGSVVPLFKEQIDNGGPVTLTDAAMTRYFMSIQEAAELIVQAGALSSGGDVFLLDMGEPMLISDLAENMIRLAGLSIRSTSNPDGDIEIVTVGKRPGEKMFEELFYDPSAASPTRHPRILRVASATGPELQGDLDRLLSAVSDENEQLARRILFEVVLKSDHLAGATSSTGMQSEKLR